MAVKLLLLGHVRQVDQSPGHDARAPIEEQLEIKPLANAWIELDSHHVVVEKIPCKLAVETKKVMTASLQSINHCGEGRNILPLITVQQIGIGNFILFHLICCTFYLFFTRVLIWGFKWQLFSPSCFI